MSTNTRTMHATPEQVWEVLADGWLYPLWVVGASRMREVDDDLAGRRAPGCTTRSAVWPLLIDDTPRSSRCSPARCSRCKRAGLAGGRGRGAAHAAARRRGDRGRDRGGRASRARRRWCPSRCATPQLHWRNVETLRRLAFLAERRAKG